MKFPNLTIVWTAGKNLALPDTLSRNTPPELLTRKTTVEIPQNIKFYLAKDETSPRLECKYAVKIDIDQSQIYNLQYFLLYLDCQNNHYEVDLLGAFTRRIIFDAFTHYVALNPVPHFKAYYAYMTLYEHWIAKFGLPEILVTDNGTEFINNEIITLCHLYNIKQKPRTSHAPWTNGLVEGMNRSLQEYLRCIIIGNDTKYTEWSADVKLFPLAYNSQITTTLGMSPYEMVFNQKPRKPIMFTANSHKNAQGYCQPNKDSICYNLPLPKHDEDHFHHPQVLKLASSTHTK